MNNLQKLCKQYEEQTPDQRCDAVGEMVSNEANVAERHVLTILTNRGLNAYKNPDPTATDILLERSGSIYPVEVKLRSGDRPDIGKSGNFFFEKITHFGTTYQQTSKTWIEKAPKYITVFSDGSLWIKNYASIRDLIAEDTIPHHYFTTKHRTRGVLVNYTELLNRKLLHIIEP